MARQLGCSPGSSGKAFSKQRCVCPIKPPLAVPWKHWIKTLGKRGSCFQQELYFKHEVPLLLVGRAYSPTPGTLQGHRGSLGQKSDALVWEGCDTCTVGTSFSTHPTVLLLWPPERNRPFQMSHFRLRWATAQRTCPSTDPANPHHIRGSPPPSLPQNHVLVFPSHLISALWGWQPRWSAAQPPTPGCLSGTGHPHPWETWPHVPRTSIFSRRKGDRSLSRFLFHPPPSLWCSTSSPLFVWRTPLCTESQWKRKRILSQWKAKNKGWPVSPAARASRALGSRKIKVWVMWRRMRRVGINSFLSLHGLWYFYNILCIPEIFFLIYHPNKHPWETLTGSCPEGRRFKKRLFPGLLNLTGKCVIVSSDCSLSLGKTQQCPKRGV